MDNKQKAKHLHSLRELYVSSRVNTTNVLAEIHEGIEGTTGESILKSIEKIDREYDKIYDHLMDAIARALLLEYLGREYPNSKVEEQHLEDTQEDGEE